MRLKIIAMIPARIGSERLKYKNLALLLNKPLIYYAINAAKNSKIFDKIYLNSDSKIFEKIAKRYNIDFYLRPKKLGKSNIRSDDVVFDFINKFESEIIVWVNPIAPLQTGLEVKKIVNYFVNKKLNSLITINNINKHYIYNKKPVNFKMKGKFFKTQDLKPLSEFVYSIMMWTSSSFKESFIKKKQGIIHGRFGTYEVSPLSGLIIKNSDDLMLAENFIKNKYKNKTIKYDKILK